MTASMYEFPRLEVTSGSGRVRAQIIGRSALAKKLQSFLRNQEVTAVLSQDFPDHPYLPESPLPDFVYWFLTHNSTKLPQVLGNYLKSSQAKLIIIFDELITYEPNELITQVLDAGIDACQIFVNDVYGPAVGETGLSLVWRDLKSKFVINLPDDDSAEIYPIYIDDAASAIVKISFSTQTYGRTFYISGADKTTVLSFSYRLREEVARQTQKLPPINYVSTSLRAPTQGRDDAAISSFSSLASATRDFLNWRPETELSQGLAKLVSYCLPPSSPSLPAEALAKAGGPSFPSPSFLKKKTTFHFRRAFVFPLALATVFFAATLSLPPLLDRLAASLAKSSPDRLARFETIFIILGRSRQFARLETAAALNLKQTEISLASGQLLQSIFGDSSISPVDTLNLLDSQVTSLLKVLPPGDNRRLLGLGRELIPSVRRILTSPQKQTFLIVFQNSAELRPTGGFISFLAFVTLQKGKILDIDYQSVDQLDSQLVGAQPPPEPIKNYLGETNWLIRDANWSADVDQSAQKLTGLIARAGGRNLAGVIFLTTPALQQILTQTGDLPDFPDTPDVRVWNRLNLVERLVYNDPGPQFASLAKALEEFIKTNSNRQKVIIAALAALDRQDLLISLPDLPDLPDYADSSDYLQVIDANLGANKADYFMIKEHDIGVSLSDTQASSAVTLRYRNSAVSSQYPTGTYRNYVRVYLPGDSIVASVVRLSAEGLVAVPTDNSLEFGRKVIGWYMEIPAAGQEIFRLEYARPVKLTLKDQITAYGLTVSKQPGTAIPTSVSIGYPPSLAPLTVSDQVAVAGNKLLLNQSGENNLFLNVEFAATE